MVVTRRSSRVKERTQSPSPGTLPCVTERHDNNNSVVAADMSIAAARAAFTSLPATPDHDPATHAKSPSSAAKTPKTPTTADRLHPPHGEMHPSKVHTATKQPDSSLGFVFKSAMNATEGDSTPTKPKAKSSPASQLSTPGFDFKFVSHESQLNEDSRKLMESMRGDVAKIKKQMQQDKKREVEQAGNQGGERKIATPKSISGRFSVAHMAEFKKMDSIADHPSAFRASPGRFQPVVKNLKRSPSKASLNDANEQVDKRQEFAVPPTAPLSSTLAARNGLRTPVRKRPTDPLTLRPHKISKLPSSASYPEGSSVRPSTIRSPAVPQTDFRPGLKSNMPTTTLGDFKSILRHQPLFSRTPGTTAGEPNAGVPDSSGATTLTASPRGDTVNVGSPQAPPSKKRVAFNLSTEANGEPLPGAFPTPTGEHTSTPRHAAANASDVVYPLLPALTPENEAKTVSPVGAKIRNTPPSIRAMRPSNASGDAVRTSTADGTHKRKRPHDVTEDGNVENIPPLQSTSDAHVSKKMKGAPILPPKTPSRPVSARGTTSSRTWSTAGARIRAKPTLKLSRLNFLARPKERR